MPQEPAHIPHLKRDPSPDRPGNLFSRLSEPEMLVGIAAIFIGMFSLGLGMYEARLERDFHRVSVWPNLEILLEQNQTSASIHVQNTGLGPARIDAVLVTVDGSPMLSWNDVLRKILPKVPARFSSSTLDSRVLRSGADIAAIEIAAADLPPDIAQRIKRLGITIGFSSVFGDRWILRSSSVAGHSTVSEEVGSPLQPTVDASF